MGKKYSEKHKVLSDEEVFINECLTYKDIDTLNSILLDTFEECDGKEEEYDNII